MTLAPPERRAPAGANPDLLPLLGRTPLARITTDLPHGHPGFWAKLECLAAGGMKARAAMSMLTGARRRGELRPGAPVVESTSGTMGIGLAFAGQTLGHPVILVGDTELEPTMRQLLRAYGARLELVDTPARHGGWQAARITRLREVLARTDGAYWPDQYNNPDNPSGYRSMAAELIGQLDHLDVLVCSVGTGGHSTGLVGPLRRRWPRLKVIGVDSVGSAIFGQPTRARRLWGGGPPPQPPHGRPRRFGAVGGGGAAG
ncbi:PLP-dependent cysteine synthase family protein, partial [Streptomyces sp. NPDC059385]|uniref:PLP-dependent cysteine synthase family protein n=1 Tax=Streptomyces sp. NPDC059385 TaxID=3346817 RepID=UPI0036A39617